jgi:hypothetical protein
MNDAIKHQIAALGHQAHDLTESAYRRHPARRGDPEWADKQRILLADMALHLLQTALRDGVLSAPELQRNLYAILTVSDQFLPDSGLKASADRLHAG